MDIALQRNEKGQDLQKFTENTLNRTKEVCHPSQMPVIISKRSK